MLMALRILLSAAVAAADKLSLTQSARFKDGSLHLLKQMPDIDLVPMDEPDDTALLIDASETYQSIVGFGGAFTEAAAINWRLLSPEEQDEVIRLYFGSPEDGGHGYSLGRVPMNSCDFSPASYNFDNVTGDQDLAHFDTDVKHDVEVGMIPMIQAAMKEAAKHDTKISLFASPWSPPGWMKLPVDGKQGMTISASPNCLNPDMQDAWARYFAAFISAYSAHGIPMWGVTVQNEPEAAVGWEACLYTASFMASFVKDYLGPTLEKEHPDVKIIGFDHNKDHVLEWARELYADDAARRYFSGVGVHWYGGLNTENLKQTHLLAPEKFILATEACNCGGVVYQEPDVAQWWSRAESLGLDILEDLRFWAVGWTDWNLVLSTKGGPNHLKNLCDANIIVDASNEFNHGKLIMQASYYFMGHFSRFIPAGSLRTKLSNSVEVHTPPIAADDVKNGQALVMAPCDGDPAQRWQASDDGSVHVVGTESAIGSDGYEHGGMCIDFAVDSSMKKLQAWSCWAGSPNQVYNVTKVPGGERIMNVAYGQCVTVVKGPGTIAGADPGTTVTAAQLHDCKEPGDASQTFQLSNYDGGGFPQNFPIRWDNDFCLQPRIEQVPHFDSVSFISPKGVHTLVVMNIGEQSISFSLYDQTSKLGAKGLSVPSHAIQTYTWQASGQLSVEAHALLRAAAVGGAGEEGAAAQFAASRSTAEPMPGYGHAGHRAAYGGGLPLAREAGLVAEEAEEAEAAQAADVAAAQRMQAQPQAAPRAPPTATGDAVLVVAALIIIATAAGLLAHSVGRRQWRPVASREALLAEEHTQGADYAPFIAPRNASHTTRPGARALT